jgi:hypothetical protein
MNQQDFQPGTGVPVHQNSGTRSHNELSPLAAVIARERSRIKAVSFGCVICVGINLKQKRKAG